MLHDPMLWLTFSIAVVFVVGDITYTHYRAKRLRRRMEAMYTLNDSAEHRKTF